MNWARNIVEQLMSVPQNLEFFLLSLWDGKLNTARNYNGNTLFDPIWRRTKKIDLFLCFSLSFANQSIAFKVTHRVGTFLRSSWMIQVIFVYFYDFLLAALRTLSAFPFFLLSDTELFHFQLFCSHTDMANLMMGCYFYRISMSVSRFYLWNVLKDLINLFFCNIFTGFSWHLRETRNNFENLINNISVNWDIKCMSILRSLNFLCFAMQSFIWDRLCELFGKSGDSASFLNIHNIFELCTSPNWINGQFRIWNLNFFSLSDFLCQNQMRML